MKWERTTMPATSYLRDIAVHYGQLNKMHQNEHSMSFWFNKNVKQDESKLSNEMDAPVPSAFKLEYATEDKCHAKKWKLIMSLAICILVVAGHTYSCTNTSLDIYISLDSCLTKWVSWKRFLGMMSPSVIVKHHKLDIMGPYFFNMWCFSIPYWNCHIHNSSSLGGIM